MSAKSPGPDAGPSARLRQRIRDGGPIRFDDFMQAALYDPQGGYYASAQPRTGRGGDFFTNVSVGPVFGRLLAAQFAEMWNLLGCPGDFTLVEQGASDGRLLADVLGALARDHPQFRPRAILVEPLPALRARQEETLAPWHGRVEWVAHEGDLPAFTGAFYANELLDAFPVRLFLRDGLQWRERLVSLDGERFIFTDAEIPADSLPAAVRNLPLPEPTIRFQVEFAPAIGPWMQDMAAALQRGWMLLIDYGHPATVRWAPQRAEGTLAACRGHRRIADPLSDPGEQDLTTHLDFSAVARAGLAAGWQLAGFTDQHHALAALAAKVFPGMRSGGLSPDEAREMRALRQLLHPESMGTAFKFLGLARGTDATPAAFALARNLQLFT